MTNYYEGKRILVTGGTGFLGRHLVDELEQVDCEWVAPYNVNLTDKKQAMELFYDLGPFDIVFHLAAKCNGIKDNIKNGLSYYTTNTAIDLNVMECCHKFRVDKVIAAGSVCMYPDIDDIPIDEQSLTGGYPSEANYHYGMAKRSLQILMEGYNEHMYCAFPILSNLYGPGDHFFYDNAHVIPSIITKFYAEKNPILWGNGTPTRDFLYVKDAARALVLAGEKVFDVTPFNVSPSLPTPVSDLANKIASRMGVESYAWDTSKPNGTMHRHYSNQRMKKMLGDFEFTSLDDGLDATLKDFNKECEARGLLSVAEVFKERNR